MAPHASMAYFEAHRSFTFSHDTCRDTLRQQELIEFGEQRSDSGVVGGKGGGSLLQLGRRWWVCLWGWALDSIEHISLFQWVSSVSCCLGWAKATWRWDIYKFPASYVTRDVVDKRLQRNVEENETSVNNNVIKPNFWKVKQHLTRHSTGKLVHW